MRSAAPAALLFLFLTSCSTVRSAAPSATPAVTEGRRQLTVLYVADLHAQLDTHPELFWKDGVERRTDAGGLARLATAIDEIRRERGGDVLLIDAGDTFQGSAIAARTEGAAMIEPLNAIGFDAAVPGNWEVVYGPQILSRRAGQLAYPMVAENVWDEATGERLFPPWLMKEVGGVRVAIVGYTDPDVPRRQPPAYSRGLRYTDHNSLQPLIDEIRQREQPDVVLLVSHIGLTRAVWLAGELNGVDAHLSADTHERTYAPIERNGSWVVEPGAFGSFLGRLDLWIEGGRVVDRRWELIEVTADRYPQDPRIQSLVDAAKRGHAEELDRVLGTIQDELVRYSVIESQLDSVIADALREATGADIALSNGFRFGSPLPVGPVTEAQLWDILPISTPVKVGKVTGAQLRAFWEQEIENALSADPLKRFGGWLPRPSGMTVVFEAGAPFGQRVREIRVHGDLLDPERVYTLAACEREGDAPDTLCRIQHAKETRTFDFDAHEAVRRYLRSHPNLEAPAKGRVVATDLPAVLRTQQPELM